MKIENIQAHRYAPELNIAILPGGVVFDCPGVTSIRELRRKYFKPAKRGKYAVIQYTNENMPGLDRKYSGSCENGYKTIKTTMAALRKRHNVPGGSFKIKIWTV